MDSPLRQFEASSYGYQLKIFLGGHGSSNPDYFISQMPDDVLVRMLSFLPIKDAGATSSLSTRWEFLWCNLTQLNFNLMSRCKDIDYCLRFALDKKVEKLDLNLLDQSQDAREFLWNNFDLPLPSLDGNMIHLVEWPSSSAMVIKMPSLKEVSLKGVNISEPNLLGLLKSSPCLERLYIFGARLFSHIHVGGRDISLKYFTIVTCPEVYSISLYDFDLESFIYDGPEIDIRLTDLPMLKELDFSEDCIVSRNNVLAQISSFALNLQVLCLNIDYPKEILTFYIIPELPNVKKLMLRIAADGDDSLLDCISIAKACPRLEDLAFELLWFTPMKRRRKVMHAPPHAHEHLKFFRIGGYYGRTSDLELVVYFIDNAVALRKIVIDPMCLAYSADLTATKLLKREKAAQSSVACQLRPILPQVYLRKLKSRSPPLEQSSGVSRATKVNQGPKEMTKEVTSPPFSLEKHCKVMYDKLAKVLAPLGYGKVFCMVVIFFFKELDGRLQMVRVYLFWNQKWVPYEEDFYIRHPRGPFIYSMKVSDFITHGQWDVNKLQAHLFPIEADFISRIPISSTRAQDKLVWHYDSKGVYTVRSGYRQALIWNMNESSYASSSGSPTNEFWKQIWRLKIVPKITFSGGLVQTLLLHPFQSKIASTKFLSYFATLAWSIWKVRNRYIFDHFIINPAITDDAFQSAVSSESISMPVTNGISWIPPTSNLIKLNCDASFKDSSAAIRIVAREKCRSESVLAAELSVIRSACILAATNGWNDAIIESDSQAAISLASTEDVPPWALAALISDIQYWKSQMNLQLSWTSRVCNFAAHQVAKVAYFSDVNFIWLDNFPSVITSIARSDAL
ncbi:F-box domain, FBD domain, Leucine-rich repeat domain, L domain-like protein [Artemisia annua]|uniref:F-box domain, FBD domain, Leucine-rich repeat domain, L domain-like protein n=1 Tax=Artemisia annua TaxID=35608 RepID=A0A2U1Q9C3_ARTAN|nr:F-box domain, FBD domain, Leucine-rich repeat domain, L domain-like protein [Artemisia annua]